VTQRGADIVEFGCPGNTRFFDTGTGTAGCGAFWPLALTGTGFGACFGSNLSGYAVQSGRDGVRLAGLSIRVSGSNT